MVLVAMMDGADTAAAATKYCTAVAGCCCYTETTSHPCGLLRVVYWRRIGFAVSRVGPCGWDLHDSNDFPDFRSLVSKLRRNFDLDGDNDAVADDANTWNADSDDQCPWLM